MGKAFEVTVPRTYQFEEGFGVDITAVFDFETEAVREIDVSVVPILEDLVHLVGGVPCVPLGDGAWVPVENFERLEDEPYDDTHDLRDRFFETREEAEEHARYTKDRFDNPQPWESFITL